MAKMGQFGAIYLRKPRFSHFWPLWTPAHSLHRAGWVRKGCGRREHPLVCPQIPYLQNLSPGWQNLGGAKSRFWGVTACGPGRPAGLVPGVEAENDQKSTFGVFATSGRTYNLIPKPVDVSWRVVTGAGAFSVVWGRKTGFLSKKRGQPGVCRAAGGCGGWAGCGG